MCCGDAIIVGLSLCHPTKSLLTFWGFLVSELIVTTHLWELYVSLFYLTVVLVFVGT